MITFIFLFPFEAKIPIPKWSLSRRMEENSNFSWSCNFVTEERSVSLTTVQKLAQTNSSQYHWSPNTHWDLSFSDLDWSNPDLHWSNPDQDLYYWTTSQKPAKFQTVSLITKFRLVLIKFRLFSDTNQAAIILLGQKTEFSEPMNVFLIFNLPFSWKYGWLISLIVTF